MTYRIIDDMMVFGDPIQNAVDQMSIASNYAERAVLCADHHLGIGASIGSVLAFENHISPAYVGADIGCGNKAVRLDIPVDEVRNNIEKIMDDVWSTISFGIGGVNKEGVDNEDANNLFEHPIWYEMPVGLKISKKRAVEQLGSCGSGNHYLDVFISDKHQVWLGTHFGSRGLGHKISSFFMKTAGDDHALLDVYTDLGQSYLAHMDFAGQYAKVGRDWVCERVARILGANILEEVHNHHNFAWREVHDAKPLWVIRKGATPNYPGERSFVGSTMADVSVILEGVDSEENEMAMYSTIHGAGRAMSRTQAKGKMKRKGKEMIVVREGQISRSMMMDRVNAGNIELRGAGVDEAPQAYKRLDDVLAHHMGTVKVVERLTPIGVAMAGSGYRE